MIFKVKDGSRRDILVDDWIDVTGPIPLDALWGYSYLVIDFVTDQYVVVQFQRGVDSELEITCVSPELIEAVWREIQAEPEEPEEP
jgi:hypothetical protein